MKEKLKKKISKKEKYINIKHKKIKNRYRDILFNNNFRNSQNYVISDSIKFKMFYEEFEKINILYVLWIMLWSFIFSFLSPFWIIIFILGFYFIYLYIKNLIIIRLNKYQIRFKNKRMNYWYIFRKNIFTKIKKIDFLFISKKAFYKFNKNNEK